MSTILQVPHRLQLADGYCLPACVQMVLAYWGIEVDQTRLARQLGLIRGAGVPASRLHRLSSRRLAVSYQSGSLAGLSLAIHQGIPPIALVYTGELPYWHYAAAHAVVVVGIEQGVVTLNDPGQQRGAIEVAAGDFLLAWDEMANLYALIQPR